MRDRVLIVKLSAAHKHNFLAVLFYKEKLL